MVGRLVSTVGALAAGAALLGAPGSAAGAGLPAGFTETTVVDGLVYPTAVAFARDGRIFVAEQSGRVKVFDRAGDRRARVVADLRTDVHNFFERGLLGMTLHPRFPKKPHLFVLYARDAPIGGSSPTWGSPGATSDDCPGGITGEGCLASGRLLRLTVKGNRAKGRKVLVDDWCQQYLTHSVGDLVFGASGALYASGGEGASAQFPDYGQEGAPPNPCGDPPVGVGGQQTPPTAEGGALRSQDLRTDGDPAGLNGTVIRINSRTGQAPADNPLASHPDPNVRRVVSYGHRNPYRLAVRPGTDEVWVADVGSDYFDEINRVAGEVPNFGWPCYEGPSRNPPFDGLDLDLCESLYAEEDSSAAALAPWFTYARQEPVIPGDGCQVGQSAVSGLAFYSGGGFPDAYNGALFFADYARTCIWVLLAGADGLPNPGAVAPFAVGVGGPVDLELGPGGLYYLDILDGALRRISYAGSNRPPRARVRASRTYGPTPLRVRFSARGSRDPEGKRLRYSWDLNGDGRFGDARRRRVTEVYRRSQPVTVALRVFDRAKRRDTDEVRVFPGNTPPQLHVSRPRASKAWVANDTLRFAGSARDSEDGALRAGRLDWELLLRHCRPKSPCHTHPVQTFAGKRRGSFETPEHEHPSFLKLRVTATDSDGLATTRELALRPRTAKVTLHSKPSGLLLGLNNDYLPRHRRRPVVVVEPQQQPDRKSVV